MCVPSRVWRFEGYCKDYERLLSKDVVYIAHTSVKYEKELFLFASWHAGCIVCRRSMKRKQLKKLLGEESGLKLKRERGSLLKAAVEHVTHLNKIKYEWRDDVQLIEYGTLSSIM